MDILLPQHLLDQVLQTGYFLTPCASSETTETLFPGHIYLGMEEDFLEFSKWLLYGHGYGRLLIFYGLHTAPLAKQMCIWLPQEHVIAALEPPTPTGCTPSPPGGQQTVFTGLPVPAGPGTKDLVGFNMLQEDILFYHYSVLSHQHTALDKKVRKTLGSK